MIHESSSQRRPMLILDWFVIALMACAIIFPVLFASVDVHHRQFIEHAATPLAVLGCVLLLSWMWLADGAHSGLWVWLPPFWPWGRYFGSTVSRWCLVVLLVIGTVPGWALRR